MQMPHNKLPFNQRRSHRSSERCEALQVTIPWELCTLKAVFTERKVNFDLFEGFLGQLADKESFPWAITVHFEAKETHLFGARHVAIIPHPSEQMSFIQDRSGWKLGMLEPKAFYVHLRDVPKGLDVATFHQELCSPANPRMQAHEGLRWNTDVVHYCNNILRSINITNEGVAIEG